MLTNILLLLLKISQWIKRDSSFSICISIPFIDGKCKVLLYSLVPDGLHC